MKKHRWLAALAAMVMALAAFGCKSEIQYVDKTYCSAVTFTSEATTDGVKVTMATTTEGAVIYYTTDGTLPTKESTEYSEAVEFTKDATVKAIAIKEGIENSPVSVATVSIKEKTITETKIEYVDKTYCSAVTFTSEATVDGVKITMATTTAGAVIYYTTDGTLPTKESTKYSKAIEFTKDATVKAIAIKEGIENSPVSVATVSIKEKTITETKIEYVDKTYCSAVTFTSEATVDGVKITMATTTAGAVIYYTTDGTLPTKESTKYSKAIEFTKDATVKAIAIKEGIENSPVSVATVSIKEKTITETKIEYVDKTYCSAVTFTSEATVDGVKITMATTTAGAVIYYTTDGTLPTKESTKYSKAIEFTKDATVKAIAIKEGIENSPVSVATVSIKEKTIIADETAPKDVEKFAVVNKDAAALLTWKDPTDRDLFGIEVTYRKSTSSRAISVMEKESIFVAPGTENVVITGLTNGTLYTFTVKAMDLSGNKSTGVTKTLTPSIIEKSPLQITLTPDVTAKTNGNVTVSVSAVTDSASAVKKIAFTQGTVAEIGTVLGKTDITETKTFTVTENGSYTVAATDTAGRRELCWITVNNIDKTAPAAVTNLEAAYDYANKKVTISWKDPSDSDFAKAEVTYKLGAEEPVTVEVEKGVQKYELENIESEVTVNVSVKAFDDVENAGVAVDTQTVTKATFAIRSITLSRDHLEYKSGKQITATIKGDNFNLLPTGEDALTVKVYDGSTLVSSCTTVADVNTENNTATATFTSPDGTDSTTGTTYTVETVVNVEKQGVNTTFRVSSKPSIYSFYIYNANNSQVSAIPVSDVTAQTTVKATIKAYNFDIADEIKLAFFDSTGNEISGASKIVTEEDYAFKNTTSYETFSVNVPVPQDEGVYTLKAIYDGNVISYSSYKTLQIYGVPKFTSFTIPNAGTAANGTQFTAIFRGKNFAAPDVDVSLFKATCDSKKTITADSSVTVINDTTATVLLTIPDTEGTYNVTLTYGEESTNADFFVKDYSSYTVGDVMLRDGTKVDYQENQTFTDDQKSKAVAVIFGFRNGAPLGVGIVHSRSGLAWCTSDAEGYSKDITALQGDKTSGYMNGSDGWKILKEVCSDAESNPENYPAWNYCRNYGANNGLEGDLATGWYLPTVAELYTIYQNKTVVNARLVKAGGSTFGESRYWSCCQYPSISGCARGLRFYDGWTANESKNSYNSYVCSVRAF